MKIRALAAMLWCACLSAWAADLPGTVIVNHKLTKRNVTVSAPAYDRGIAVDLGSDPLPDPLAYERTHVVIYIEGESANAGISASMEQKNRRFVPDLLVVPAGSTVSFPNLDPIFHNVFSLSGLKAFDLGNYPRGQTKAVTFSKPGIVLVNCHLHSNMTAVIFVSPNAWSTQPDSGGHFVLRDVPPGRHILAAWHKTAGTFRQTVDVSRTQPAAPVQFTIPLDKNGVPIGQLAQVE